MTMREGEIVMVTSAVEANQAYGALTEGLYIAAIASAMGVVEGTVRHALRNDYEPKARAGAADGRRDTAPNVAPDEKNLNQNNEAKTAAAPNGAPALLEGERARVVPEGRAAAFGEIRIYPAG